MASYTPQFSIVVVMALGKWAKTAFRDVFCSLKVITLNLNKTSGLGVESSHSLH